MPLRYEATSKRSSVAVAAISPSKTCCSIQARDAVLQAVSSEILNYLASEVHSALHAPFCVWISLVRGIKPRYSLRSNGSLAFDCRRNHPPALPSAMARRAIVIEDFPAEPEAGTAPRPASPGVIPLRHESASRVSGNRVGQRRFCRSPQGLARHSRGRSPHKTDLRAVIASDHSL